MPDKRRINQGAVVHPDQVPIDRKEEASQALLKALRHPLRRELLRRYLEAEKPLGPTELADWMNQPLSTVSYHIRELARFMAIEVVEEEQRRGSVAHLYETTSLLDEAPWAQDVLRLAGGTDG